MPLRAFEQLAVDTDVVNFEVGFAAQFGHNLAVHRNQSAGD